MTNDELSVEACSTAEAAFWSLRAQEQNGCVVQVGAGIAVYDLGERTSRFGEQIILFAKKMKL